MRKKIKGKIKKYSVLVMAGGQGTRLAPFTHVLPKPLIPINKKTLIEHILDEIKKNHVKKVFFSVSNKSKTLISYLEELEKRNFKMTFFKENKPLGTIGILSKIYNKLERDILITNCDTIIKFNYNKIFEHHKKNNNGITLVLAKKHQKLSYGSCQIKKNSNELISIKEKPSISYIANTGFFFVRRDLAKLIPKNSYFDATSFIEKCINRGLKVGTFLIKEKNWLDVGQWKEYQYASEKLKIK